MYSIFFEFYPVNIKEEPMMIIIIHIIKGRAKSLYIPPYPTGEGR